MTNPLSQRQTQVLLLVAAGLSDNEIAEQMRLSPGTVHRYLAAVRDRLHARNRAHALIIALQQGYLVLDGETLRAA